VLEKFTGRLTQMGVLSHRDLRSLTKYQLILARDQFRSNPPPHIMGAQQGILEGDFALCITLYHGHELLLQMGLRSLFLFVQGIMNGTKEMARARNELQRTVEFMELYQEMEQMFVKPVTGLEEPFIYSHPKLQKLEEVVLQHFQTWTDSTGQVEGSNSGCGPKHANTRVMIFSSFRESVQEIAEMLNRHLPQVRVMTFMGQASAGKGVRGFTQKEQLEVVRCFREGGFNTLVSTCVGEEGLDIGDVDLIVCFDAQKSPIRLVQRMGRTGRHRQGRIVVILAEGREERTYNQSQINKRSVYKAIMGKKQSFRMFPHCPRMLPEGVNPTLHKMFITCGQFEHRETGRRSSKGRKSIAEAQESFFPRAQYDSVKEDGLLSPRELSLWSSTMRLGADEPQPELSHSYFLSIASDAPPQEQESEVPCRKLSLSEWSYWQNRPFPTHQVGHSDRCQHFIQIMDLIDSLRLEEEEGNCGYEAELMPYLNKEDVVGYRAGCQAEMTSDLKKVRADIANRKQKSYAIEEADSDFAVPRVSVSTGRTSAGAPWTSIKEKIPAEKDNGVGEGFAGDKGLTVLSQMNKSGHAVPDLDVDIQDDCILVLDENEEREVVSLTPMKDNADDHRQHSPDCHSTGVPSLLGSCEKFSSDAGYSSLPEESCPELGSMFYLPQWDIDGEHKLQPLSATQEKVKALLANVRDYLTRSQRPDSDLDCSSFDLEPLNGHSQPEPGEWGDPFQVNFCLDIEGKVDKWCDSASSQHNSDVVPSDSHVGGEIPKRMDSMPEPNSSPSWDEVFDDVEDIQDCNSEAAGCLLKEPLPQPGSTIEGLKDPDTSIPAKVMLEESMDLFGDDDDAFLQVSIPGLPSDRALTQTHNKASEQRENAGLKRAVEVKEGEWLKESYLASPGTQSRLLENTECFKYSQELFSVNFDLGYSIDDSEEEEEPGPGNGTERAFCHSHAVAQQRSETSNLPPPEESFHSPVHCRDRHQGCVSTPLADHSGRKGGPPMISRVASLLSPIISRFQGAPLPQLSGMSTSHSPIGAATRSRLTMSEPHSATTEGKTPTLHVDKVTTNRSVLQDHPPGKRKMSVVRRRAAALSTSEGSESEETSDQDFQDLSMKFSKVPCPSKLPTPQGRTKKAMGKGARAFLDEEAELSEDGGSISSDEGEEEEHDHSLAGFVVDTTQLSQGMNDSEMRGVYMKSVRSPAVYSKYKMVNRVRQDIDIFSQVPEQDETYGEDSFVVQGSEVEELESSEEEEAGRAELILEESFVEGRRMYPTRRRAQIRRARAAGEGQRYPNHQPPKKTKRSRII
ncbi:hypothetical protein JZ751_002768, partial [Albula glossodonta]